MKKPKAKRSSPIRTRRNPIPPARHAAPIHSPRLKRSTAPKLPTRQKTKGAFGKKRASLAAKRQLLAASCAQANELTQAKRLDRAYKEFFATADGKRFTKEFGKSYSDSSPRRAGAGGDCDPQFCDPADLPAASVLDHPVDNIEPMSDSVEIDGLSETEIKTASEIFSDVLRWGLGYDLPVPVLAESETHDALCEGISRVGEARESTKYHRSDGGNAVKQTAGNSRGGQTFSDSPLVIRGKRSIVLIAFMRPDLAADKIDSNLSASFLLQFGGKLAELEAAGLLFGRYLEWMRRSNTFSAYGERLDITAYMLRPDLLPASTLAKLGEILNKSRQAKDKLANCARDTFAGLKAPPMRNDITRARCRASQVRAGLAEAANQL